MMADFSSPTDKGVVDINKILSSTRTLSFARTGAPAISNLRSFRRSSLMQYQYEDLYIGNLVSGVNPDDITSAAGSAACAVVDRFSTQFDGTSNDVDTVGSIAADDDAHDVVGYLSGDASPAKEPRPPKERVHLAERVHELLEQAEAHTDHLTSLLKSMATHVSGSGGGGSHVPDAEARLSSAELTSSDLHQLFDSTVPAAPAAAAVAPRRSRRSSIDCDPLWQQHHSAECLPPRSRRSSHVCFAPQQPSSPSSPCRSNARLRRARHSDADDDDTVQQLTLVAPFSLQAHATVGPMERLHGAFASAPGVVKTSANAPSPMTSGSLSLGTPSRLMRRSVSLSHWRASCDVQDVDDVAHLDDGATHTLQGKGPRLVRRTQRCPAHSSLPAAAQQQQQQQPRVGSRALAPSMSGRARLHGDDRVSPTGSQPDLDLLINPDLTHAGRRRSSEPIASASLPGSPMAPCSPCGVSRLARASPSLPPGGRSGGGVGDDLERSSAAAAGANDLPVLPDVVLPVVPMPAVRGTCPAHEPLCMPTAGELLTVAAIGSASQTKLTSSGDIARASGGKADPWKGVDGGATAAMGGAMLELAKRFRRIKLFPRLRAQ